MGTQKQIYRNRHKFYDRILITSTPFINIVRKKIREHGDEIFNKKFRLLRFATALDSRSPNCYSLNWHGKLWHCKRHINYLWFRLPHTADWDKGVTIKVTAAILVIDEKLLIAKRKPDAKLPNLWELPGGKIEPNESPEECLKRELKEEFGIDVTIGEYIGSNTHTYDFGTIELMAYRTLWIKGDFKLNDHDEIRWIDKHDPGQYSFAPADIPFIDKIKRGEIEL